MPFTLPSVKGMSFVKPFRLTPNTGNRLREVQELVERHNIRATLQGHDTKETSLGRSLAFLVLTRGVAALMKADAALLSLDHAPSVTPDALLIPNTTLRLAGEPLSLTAQTLSVAQLGLGDYAIVLEAYRALVGPTTAGRETEPAIFATISDSAGKPSATELYPAGCLDFTSGPSDAPLATATVQTQKFEQWQYRIRLIPDRDLAGYASDLIPMMPKYAELPAGEQVPSANYAPLGDGLHFALLPDRPESYARAYDRRLYACKLGVLRMGAAGASLRLNTLQGEEAWLGDAPALILAGRRELALQTAQALKDHAGRLALLEARSGSLDLHTNEAFAVADEAAGGSALSRCVPFPKAAGNLAGLFHDPLGAPAEVQATEAVRLQISASVTFAPAVDAGVRGLRLLKNGLPTGYVSLAGNAPGAVNASSLSAQISALPLDRFALEVVQTSGAVLLATESVMSISRIA